MNNILKGWITSIIGLSLMVGTGLHFFGVYKFDHPDKISEPVALCISFVVGMAMFFIPSTKLEEIVEGLVKRKSDQL